MANASTNSASSDIVHVHAVIDGGPMTPSGQTLYNGTPLRHDRLTVHAGKRTWTAVTDRYGRATFDLGNYRGKVTIMEKRVNCSARAIVPRTTTVMMRCVVP